MPQEWRPENGYHYYYQPYCVEWKRERESGREREKNRVKEPESEGRGLGMIF